MAVQFGSTILDTFLAPGISSFNEVDIPDLSSELSQSQHWISNLFLNSILGSRYNESWKHTAIAFLFRTQNALRAYSSARDKTMNCVALFQPGRPASHPYFEAISDWETVLINIQVTLDLFLKFMDPKATVTDDARRIRLATNRIKHFAEDIVDGSHGADLTLPLWLSKDGLRTRIADVKFEEIAENLRAMTEAAEILQNPGYLPPSSHDSQLGTP